MKRDGGLRTVPAETRSERSPGRRLVPLYAASGLLTIGEGGLLVLLSPYLEARGLAEATIGVVMSAYGVASLVTRLPAGLAYSARRAGRLVTAGCLLSAVAFLLLPFASHAIVLTALVGLDGVGFAAATTGVMAGLIDRRPPGAEAGTVMGWYSGSVGAGYAISGFVAGMAGDAFGIRTAIFLLASIPLVGSVLLPAALGRPDPDRSASPPEPFSLRARVAALLRAPSAVWLAFLVTLYINLVSGIMFTFFPLYGLAIGLSLTQIGVLTGIHGSVAAAIRFASAMVFRKVSYRGALPAMVLVSGAAIVTLGTVEVYAVMAVCWGAIGLARGILRVASGALILDEAAGGDSGRGGASAIYLAGLDLGKILGPIVGGLTAEAVGLGPTFVALGAAFPALYLVASAALMRRGAGRGSVA
jgi:predicted MFS family arabinose efflux permease